LNEGAAAMHAHPVRAGGVLRWLPFRVYWVGCAGSTRHSRVSCPLLLSPPVQQPLR